MEYVPPGFEADHANGNPLDNRRTNLRIVTHHQNVMNRRGWGRSKHKGVGRSTSTQASGAQASRTSASATTRGITTQRLQTRNTTAKTVQHGDFARLNEVP